MLVGMAGAAAGQTAGDELIAGHIGRLLQSSAGASEITLDEVTVPVHEDLGRFYRKRSFRPAWLDGGQVSATAVEWSALLQGVAAEGLEPVEYHAETLVIALEQARLTQAYGGTCQPAGLARLDVLLSDAFLRYASHLLGGRIDPGRLYADEWQVDASAAQALTVLEKVLQSGKIGPVLDRLVPFHTGYRRLAGYLDYYRRLARAGGWPALPDGEVVRPGESDVRVPLLRHYLVLTGDLDLNRQSASARLDEATVAALKRFQQRHGLHADGVLGQATLGQINVPLAERLRQIALNLERCRWLPDDREGRYLQVDITDFSLSLFDEGRRITRMPVVVGTSFRRTPVFSALLTYLVFAPYWNVPPTILRQDKLPLIKADPSYLTTHHYQIVAWGKDPNRLLDPDAIDWKTVSADSLPGMLRQKPGPWNPLGRVKFVFPNAFHVYLHDTPQRHLFREDQRTFSSGCIRIARPLELADWLLRGQKGWDRKRVRQAMQGTQPLHVRLAQPLPVHILYRTAWVDAQGKLQFRADVYRHDAQLQAALDDRAGRTIGHRKQAGLGSFPLSDAQP
jgi:murein L,D-transpeptidase YcbB/YkuD